MIYKPSQIMTRAWEILKAKHGQYSKANMRNAMCHAWKEAKAVAVNRIRAAISMLDNKSFRYSIPAERAALMAQLTRISQ